jgi:hypothetical protein
LVGLTSLTTRNPPMPSKLDRRRAQFVLTQIDQILAWEHRKEAERDTRFVELGRYLCEVRACQYWRLENLKSFDEFLERRFPQSRRKAYYLMSIHEHLPPTARKELKAVGWTKGLELAKVARRDGQEFDCATWLHKAREMPKDQFKREVEKELTGKDTEPWEIIYFKLYQSQIPVIEQAIGTAARMLGSDTTRIQRHCCTRSLGSSRSFPANKDRSFCTASPQRLREPSFGKTRSPAARSRIVRTASSTCPTPGRLEVPIVRRHVWT